MSHDETGRAGESAGHPVRTLAIRTSFGFRHRFGQSGDRRAVRRVAPPPADSRPSWLQQHRLDAWEQ